MKQLTFFKKFFPPHKGKRNLYSDFFNHTNQVNQENHG
jgi:hypothetical protein